MQLLKETIRDFLDDDCPRLAAALSYYTVFALPPLLILILMLVGTLVDPASIQGSIERQFRDLLGAEGAQQVRTMIDEANRPDFGGPLTAALGVLLLLFGATGAFVQLQAALNKAWEVQPDPARGGVRSFLLKRALSVGMVLAIAFILLVSLVASAAISAFGDVLAGYLPAGIGEAVLWGVQLGLSLAVFTLLFAAIYRVLPDADVPWRTVWVGAFVTAVLFVAGKFGLGFWLGRSDPGEAYGAAGSLALILVWVYYSAMIVLLGAEFTHVWARRSGGRIRPSAGAVSTTTTAAPRAGADEPATGF
jgi:membrane protein